MKYHSMAGDASAPAAGIVSTSWTSVVHHRKPTPYNNTYSQSVNKPRYLQNMNTFCRCSSVAHLVAMASKQSIVALLSVLVCLLCIDYSESAGSTLHLKDIVLGRCSYYQQFKMSNLGKTSNCTAIWKAFHDGFAFKDPCKLTFADYEPFFDLVKGGNIVDKSLFWSGTYKAVHSYSDFDLRFTTLEDTFGGWMMNGLGWCGNPSLPRNSSDGIDYQSCPNSSTCEIHIAFWGLASKKFAERVRGVVRVMVNGTRAIFPAYKRSSFFGKYELPSFNVAAISKLEVIVVHTIGKNEIEKCGSGSIGLLIRDAEARGLSVDCVDDPDAVKHILCTDHPTSRECLFLGNHGNQSATDKDCGVWKSIGISLAVMSIVLLIVTVAMIITLGKVLLRSHADDREVLT